MGRVSVSLRGDKEIRKLLDSLSGKELQTRTRRATRAGSAVMRAELRGRVRSGSYPRSFSRIKTRSSTRGGIKTQTGPTSPLLSIFEQGATAHRIGPKAAGSIRVGASGDRSVVDSSSRGGFLSNLNNRDGAAQAGRWEKAFFARGAVQHPGMHARPLIAPTFEASKDAATAKAMAKLLEGIR